jgi:hypothetical protein
MQAEHNRQHGKLVVRCSSCAAVPWVCCASMLLCEQVREGLVQLAEHTATAQTFCWPQFPAAVLPSCCCYGASDAVLVLIALCFQRMYVCLSANRCVGAAYAAGG